MAYVTGFDVSHWQQPSAKLASERVAAGDRYVYVKSSQGAAGRDQAMTRHHRFFGDAGLARGPYHFFDFRQSPEANAANFLAATDGMEWELPHALDAEKGTYGDKATNARALLTFLALVQRTTNRVPVVYTGGPWWTATVAPEPEFARYPLWLARYPSAFRDGHTPPPGASVPAPAPWGTWSIWQYSDSLGVLDRNVCTPAVFDALTGHTAPSPTPPKGWLDMLSDKQQTDLYDAVMRLDKALGHTGQEVRQVIAEIDQRTADLASGKRPVKG